MGTEKSSPFLSGESIKGKPYMGGAHGNWDLSQSPQTSKGGWWVGHPPCEKDQRTSGKSMQGLIRLQQVVGFYLQGNWEPMKDFVMGNNEIQLVYLKGYWEGSRMIWSWEGLACRRTTTPCQALTRGRDTQGEGMRVHSSYPLSTLQKAEPCIFQTTLFQFSGKIGVGDRGEDLSLVVKLIHKMKCWEGTG